MNTYDPHYLVVVLNHGRGHLFARKEPGTDLQLVGSLAEATQFAKDRATEVATFINRTSPCCVRDVYVYKAECQSNQAKVQQLLGFLPANLLPAAKIPARVPELAHAWLDPDAE